MTSLPTISNNTNVKTATRIIEIFEIFASEQRPLSLSELAAKLNAPNSSSLALIRTLMNMGYLYETTRRQGYYPTKRLLEITSKINQADPILERVEPYLQKLSNMTGETTVIGKLTADYQVIYLDVIPSAKSIRYVAMPGELKHLHSNSIGKAIFSALPTEEQSKILKTLPQFNTADEHTLIHPTQFKEHIRQSYEIACFSNKGETLPDLGAIAWPVRLSDMLFGISIAGPLHRIEANIDEFNKELKSICSILTCNFKSSSLLKAKLTRIK